MSSGCVARGDTMRSLSLVTAEGISVLRRLLERVILTSSGLLAILVRLVVHLTRLSLHLLRLLRGLTLSSTELYSGNKDK